MNAAVRLAILERRRAAEESVLLNLQPWLVHGRPALASPYPAFAPRHTPCAPLQEFCDADKSVRKRDKTARKAHMAAMSPPELEAYLAPRLIPTRTPEERVMIALGLPLPDPEGTPPVPPTLCLVDAPLPTLAAQPLAHTPAPTLATSADLLLALAVADQGSTMPPQEEAPVITSII